VLPGSCHLSARAEDSQQMPYWAFFYHDDDQEKGCTNPLYSTLKKTCHWYRCSTPSTRACLGNRGTYVSLVRGSKIPVGSTVKALSLRYRPLCAQSTHSKRMPLTSTTHTCHVPIMHLHLYVFMCTFEISRGTCLYFDFCEYRNSSSIQICIHENTLSHSFAKKKRQPMWHDIGLDFT